MNPWTKFFLIMAGVFGTAAVAGVVGVTIEQPWPFSVQHGYRGTGMVEIYNPRVLAAQAEASKIPATLPQLPAIGPKASAVYKNVQELGDLSVGEFTRLMASITTWVAPEQGCNYCHNPNNMAEDGLYTKVVARRMIQMTRHVNADWKQHVAETGVTCYTCHRGQPVPANIWFNNPGPMHAAGMSQVAAGKNMPSKAAGLASLPYDPFTPFLEGSAPIRVASTTALPAGDLSTIKQTEWTYSLMAHMSTSLGVNCTYCHNTRSFSDWEQSSPQRVTAYYGIRMVRDLNTAYLDPLQATFPPARLGETGDSPKLNCATCHNGVFKPLGGVSMIKGFPELAANKK